MKLFDMMTDEDIKRLNDENKKLKKRAEEAEGENTIIKGIGQNSPEMKALQKQKEYLHAQCRKAGRALIELNNKYDESLSQVEDLNKRVKEAGRINQLHQDLIEELKADLARAKEDHQYDNLVHKNELESLKRKAKPF